MFRAIVPALYQHKCLVRTRDHSTKRQLSLGAWNEVLAKLLTAHLLRDSLCLWTVFKIALTLDLILNQLNPVSNFTIYYFKTHFNIILSSTAVPPKWTSPIRPTVLLDGILVTPFRTICSVHCILLDLIVISLSPFLVVYTLIIEKSALDFRPFFSKASRPSLGPPSLLITSRVRFIPEWEQQMHQLLNLRIHENTPPLEIKWNANLMQQYDLLNFP